MTKKYVITAAFALVALMALAWLLRSPINRGEETYPPVNQQPNQFEEKSAMVDGITILAQPQLSGQNELKFEIQLTTHSGDISGYDVQSNVRLRSGGNEFLPIQATNAAGSGPSSHHRSLDAVFPAPSNGDFTLVLRGLGSDTDTTIVWP